MFRGLLFQVQYLLNSFTYEQGSYIPEWVLNLSTIEEVNGNHDDDADKGEDKRKK